MTFQASARRIAPRSRSLLAAVVGLVAAVVAGSSGSALAADWTFPQAVTGTVVDENGAVAPGALRWSAWPLDDASRRLASHRLPQVADGALEGDVGAARPTGAAAEPWVVLVEGELDGRASFGVTRAEVGAHPSAFPPARLARMPEPALRTEGSAVVVSWDAAKLDGGIVGPDEGVEGYAVLRAGLDGRWVEVGRVTAGAEAHELADDSAPSGWWSYGVAVVAAGGVVGETRAFAGVASVGLDDGRDRLRHDPDDRLRPVLDGRRQR